MKKQISRKRVAELLDIPYSTINDWSKAEVENWRYKLVHFLQNLTEDEIRIIKERDFKIG